MKYKLKDVFYFMNLYLNLKHLLFFMMSLTIMSILFLTTDITMSIIFFIPVIIMIAIIVYSWFEVVRPFADECYKEIELQNKYNWMYKRFTE